MRGGRSLGTTSYFPRAPGNAEEVLASFLLQHYAREEAPPRSARESGSAGSRRPWPRRCRSSSGTADRWCRGRRAASRRAGWRRPSTMPPRRCACARRARADAVHAARGAAARRWQLRRRAGADRVLRHQPHRRRGHGGLLRGVHHRRASRARNTGASTSRRRSAAMTTARLREAVGRRYARITAGEIAATGRAADRWRRGAGERRAAGARRAGLRIAAGRRCIQGPGPPRWARSGCIVPTAGDVQRCRRIRRHCG